LDLDLCRRTPFKPVSPDAPLEEICKLFASGAHRVPILNAEGKVESIISQSYFIKKIIDYCVKFLFFFEIYITHKIK